ncbi:uncharacterized protein LOC110188853 [Drosophila serrata]|uniref:uncharacterized protein LOC110188853 n=1 Tax=Drosophila serrata TaxID=7274 RepID=UPI000A1D0746|nr:uncharacterized protein LOC110188853 [Drosophila serrata]XP_020814419.1 uncharacterized protein LOC110188853 [Drosophila serrata]
MSTNKVGAGDGLPKLYPVPNFRRYAVYVINNDPGNRTDLKQMIIETLFDELENQSFQNIRFNGAFPADDENILVACENEDTAKFFISAMEKLGPSYSTARYIEFLGLVPCSMVLAVPTHSRSEILDILETYNKGLVTEKWAIMERYFEGSEKDDRKEIVKMCIDAESKQFIELCGSELNCELSTVQFKFDD